MKGYGLMGIYEFIACNERLSSFREALEDETLKSYNDLIKMGFTEKQIQIRGIDLRDIDREKKVFFIQLPEELINSPLEIEEDFHHAYARYLSDQKFIYRVSNAEKVLPHLAYYIVKYADRWGKLELWRVIEDDYCVDPQDISHKSIHLSSLTLDHLESFYEGKVPCRITIFR